MLLLRMGGAILFTGLEKDSFPLSVNSLTTVTQEDTEDLKKIKILAIQDLITTDITDTINKSYVGNYSNSYDNKCLLITAIKGYLSQLEKKGYIEKDKSVMEINVEKQRAYLESTGVDTTEMDDQAVKEANTGSRVFLKGSVSILDAMLKTLAKGATIAVSAVMTGSLLEGSKLEQSIGGVETLFKDSADIVKKNADAAFQTAGLSANNYMETVTAFSASLLQSLGGDTQKAAQVADMAVVDMSDNANKMGTSMEDIQNAYQGFAKQNYTMLDNLKLGYGGTIRCLEYDLLSV